MIFLFVGVTFDIAQILDLVLIFLCYLGGIDLSGWTVLPFSLTFLVFRGLGMRLIGGRQRIMGHGLFFVPVKSLVALLSIGVVFVLLNQRPIFFWAPKIDFPSFERWLEAGFCFCSDSFFYHFVPHIYVSLSIV